MSKKMKRKRISMTETAELQTDRVIMLRRKFNTTMDKPIAARAKSRRQWG